jgi:hypothetical protein
MTSPTTRPEPVLTEAKIGALVSQVVALAVTLGFVSTADGGEITTAALGLYAAIVAVVNVAAKVIAAVRARGKVTPVAAPRDDAGNRLVPAGQSGSLYDREADAPGL